jgi:hypothetical protein
MRPSIFRPALAIAIAASALTEGVARAGDPTTADCLAASDASLDSGNHHKLRAERSQLLVCAAASCPADIRKECIHRVEEVNTQLPTIIFQARDPSGADLSAVKVTMDGEVLAERLEGTALSIDPGEHTFRFETSGQSALTKTFLIRQGEKDRREAVAFVAAETAPPEQPPAAPVTAAPPPPTEPSPEGLGTQKIVALVTGGVGVVGLGLGGAFGVLAISRKNDAESACPGPCATQDGVNRWSSAGSAGNVSTIAFVVGGIAVAGAAVLWFSAPSPSRPQIGIGPGGFQVRGAW